MSSSKKVQIAWMGRFYPAILTAASSFVVYLLTLEREVGWGDAGELSLQAYLLGVTHPTGYPLHTLLGKLFTLFVSEPGVATNLLSAVCTSLAAGVLCLLILELTDRWWLGVIVPLLLAFAPIVWSLAITTEVYNVNLLFFGLSLYLLLLWYRRSHPWLLVGTGAVFGLSFGAHLLNIILLPAFVYLVWRGGRKPVRQILVFLVFVAMFGIGILSFSFFRSQFVFPLGTQYPPITLYNAFQFFSCSECETTDWLGAAFLGQRILEHSGILLENFAYLGIPLGVLGLAAMWRKERDLAITLLAMLLIDLGYLTYLVSWEYYNMTGPAYFVLAICVACSGEWAKEIQWKPTPYLLTAILAGMCIFQVAHLYPEKEVNARKKPVTFYVNAVFNRFPQDALVVGHWNKFTPMLYFQKVHGMRPDLLLVERNPSPRYYDFGYIESDLAYIQSMASVRPVVIDIKDSRLQGQFDFQLLGRHWYMLVPKGQP